MANIYEGTNTKKTATPKVTVPKVVIPNIWEAPKPKPKPVAPKATIPKPVLPNIWEAPILKPIAPKVTTPKAVTPKPTPKPVTPKATAPKPAAPKTVTPKATTKKTVTPKTAAQELIVQEPMVQEYAVQEQPQFDVQGYINALAEARSAQAVADLGKARDNQLSNLTGEEAGIKPMYYDKRNVTAATNMMGRRSLSEELAARGETKSGVADEANIRANMSLQGETGAINRQEASDITDIARRRTGVQNAYESDVVSAKAGYESAAMQNLIDQYNADRQFKLQEGGLTGTYNGGQTMAGQNQSFNQNMATQQYNQSVKQQDLDNLYRDQTFDYQKSRDAVGDSQWQQTMNLNLREQTFSESQQQIQNAMSQRRISQEDGAQALQWARFNADQDPNSLDNQYKQAQINATNGKTNSGSTSTVDDYASTINSLYIIKPNSSNGYKSSIDASGVKSYIDKLIMSGVDDSIVDSLAARYGIQ